MFSVNKHYEAKRQREYKGTEGAHDEKERQKRNGKNEMKEELN